MPVRFLALVAVLALAPAPGAARSAPAPSSSPHVEFVREPVFGSRMLKVESGKTHDQTVILIHGLGGEGHGIWSKLIPALDGRYHVLTFDLPGFGRSEKPPAQYTPENYARLIRWLDERYAKSKSAVVGHSMGGGLALHYAARYPQRVSRVVLAGAAGVLEKSAYLNSSARLYGDQTGWPGFVTPWIDLLNDLTRDFTGWTGPGSDFLDLLRGSNAAWSALLKDTPDANAALGLITYDFSGDIEGFPHPTLLIWGGRDSVTPTRIAHLLNGRLPNSELHIIADAAHAPMYSHTLRFNTLVERALRAEINPEAPLPPPAAGKTALHCNGETGASYSGHYTRIVMKNCLGIRLNGVTAGSVELTGSTVTITHARIGSSGTALSAVDSDVTITSAEITGEVAVLADNSRLDFAGVTLTGKQAVLKVEGESRLVASVSDIRAGSKRCHVHGAYKLQRRTLESLLAGSCRYETFI